MILNKPDSVNHDQHTLCYCKFVSSQNENIDKATITSARKVHLTETENEALSKKDNLKKKNDKADTKRSGQICWNWGYICWCQSWF